MMSVACAAASPYTAAMIRHAAKLWLAVSAVLLVCTGNAPIARARDASLWTVEPHAAARLIAGAAIKTADANWLRAGIEIRLDTGWKTYWRQPGDSGVPPTLDFAGSENVKSVTTLWPAPEQFADGAGGQSIGYTRDVVLPLRILAKDASKPSVLQVKLSYAVCGNLCMPAEADLDLTLSGKASAEEPALAGAEARVPRHVQLGAEARVGEELSIRSLHRENRAGREHVIVEVSAPQGMPVDLFVEGPTRDWALPLPRLERIAASSTPGVRRFTFDLDGVPPGACAQGATLTLTAVSPVDAMEVQAHLD